VPLPLSSSVADNTEDAADQEDEDNQYEEDTLASWPPTVGSHLEDKLQEIDEEDAEKRPSMEDDSGPYSSYSDLTIWTTMTLMQSEAQTKGSVLVVDRNTADQVALDAAAPLKEVTYEEMHLPTKRKKAKKKNTNKVSMMMITTEKKKKKKTHKKRIPENLFSWESFKEP